MTTEKLLKARGYAQHFCDSALLLHYNVDNQYHHGEALKNLDRLIPLLADARAELIALQREDAA